MGYSVTWCAVREGDAQKLLEGLSLTPTGETEEVPESPLSTAKLDTGWRIIWCNEYNSRIVSPKILADMSRDMEVLYCLVEEHVIASSAEYWSAGKRRWWISHQGEDGPKGLDCGGELPECFLKIKSEMESMQSAEGGDEADVDYIFEIPLKVAQTLTGFKHDEDCPHISEEQFIVLTRPVSGKGFMSRLFRK